MKVSRGARGIGGGKGAGNDATGLFYSLSSISDIFILYIAVYVCFTPTVWGRPTSYG